MKYYFLFFLMIAQIVTCQTTEIDNWKFVVQLDNRFSSIQKNDIFIVGGKAGFQYLERLRVGIGASLILEHVTIEYFNKQTNQDEVNTMGFWYGSVFADWIAYKNQRFEVFFTEQIGFGKPNFTKTVNDKIVSDVNTNILINEISGQINYKVRPWIGLGAGFGYRNSIRKSLQIRRALDAPVYMLKLVFYPQVFLKKKQVT
ncbi:MAG: hypothetical protein RLZZ312_547 [Bacteroidota bacterium]